MTPHLIALTGHKGAGKDTVADLLVAMLPVAKKFAFADALREEVCAAFHIPLAALTNRDTKERPTWELALKHCSEPDFVDYARAHVIARAYTYTSAVLDDEDPLSPRQIMQWWGAWRREQDEDYWLKQLAKSILLWRFSKLDIPRESRYEIITDCRHSNEAHSILREHGIVIHIARTATDPIAATDKHESERGDAFAYATHTLRNDGTLDELRAECERVLKEIRSAIHLHQS
jgi:hypothetical protein